MIEYYLVLNECSVLLFVGKIMKGCYAMSVSGQLPEDVLDELDEKGVVYQTRDI